MLRHELLAGLHASTAIIEPPRVGGSGRIGLLVVIPSPTMIQGPALFNSKQLMSPNLAVNSESSPGAKKLLRQGVACEGAGALVLGNGTLLGSGVLKEGSSTGLHFSRGTPVPQPTTWAAAAFAFGDAPGSDT